MKINTLLMYIGHDILLADTVEFPVSVVWCQTPKSIQSTTLIGNTAMAVGKPCEINNKVSLYSAEYSDIPTPTLDSRLTTFQLRRARRDI